MDGSSTIWNSVGVGVSVGVASLTIAWLTVLWLRGKLVVANCSTGLVAWPHRSWVSGRGHDSWDDGDSFCVSGVSYLAVTLPERDLASATGVAVGWRRTISLLLLVVSDHEDLPDDGQEK